MNKRFYMADIIGDGTDDNSFRPVVADNSLSWSCSIPCDLSTGIPTQAWALVSVTDDDQSGLLSVAGVYPLPDYSVDALISTMSTADLAQADAALAAYGIATSLVQLGATYGAALARLEQGNTAPADALLMLTI